MKFEIENLGIVRQASLELGDLTILCGKNNAGKTYITHTIHQFLQSARKSQIFTADLLPDRADLINKGLEISFDEYRKLIEKRCNLLAETYSSESQANASSDSQSSASKTDLFKLGFDLNASQLQLMNSMIAFSGLPENSMFSVATDVEEKKFIFKLDPGGNGQNKPLIDSTDVNFVAENEGQSADCKTPKYHEARNELMQEFSKIFIPDSFIVGSERAGSMVFQKDIDLSKTPAPELLDSNSNKPLDPAIFTKINKSYPFAVQDNLNFFQFLPDATKKKGELNKQYPDIVERFQDIIGGSVSTTEDGEILFQPRTESSPPVTYASASGAVKNTIIIGCYLKHLAAPGDLLIIDEPEFGLYPENQRAMAHLIARLVNVGLQVFVTTHSDYIIKELSALIMLNRNATKIQKIREKHGYDKDILLDIEKIKVYYMRDEVETLDIDSECRPCIAIDEHKHQVLAQADVNIYEGIEMSVFDKSINKMNAIQYEIIWA